MPADISSVLQGQPAVALFDFDGTILKGNSFHIFAVQVARRFPKHALPFATAALLRRARKITAVRLKQVVLEPLRGWRLEEIRALGDDVYREQLRRRVSPTAVERLMQHAAAGHIIHILSGAFDFLLAPFCREFGITNLGCTQLRYQDGAFTGDLLGEEFLGAVKADYVDQLACDGGVDLSCSYGYSDHPSDLPMLTRVGNPVFVNLADRHVNRLEGAYIRERW